MVLVQFKDKVYEAEEPALFQALAVEGIDPKILVNVIKAIKKVFKQIGAAMCILLEFFPAQEISIPMVVSETCTLTFTIKKLTQ